VTDTVAPRPDIAAIEQVLAASNRERDEAIHRVQDNADAIFTWDYQKGKRPGLAKLYEKAKHAQWNGETDLDWSTEVDAEKVAHEMSHTAGSATTAGMRRLSQLPGSPVAAWGDTEWDRFEVEALNWRLSQFMHGEQGALICTAKIVETVPWIDAKYYGATQVMDEARHVEVFARYLDEKLPDVYPINIHLEALLDDIILDGRWDMTYLGMQIMVEGLALAAFGSMHKACTEPLLKSLLRLVMSDEARHVAFGVLSLQEIYRDMGAHELRERQEFAFEALLRMRDRFLMQEVWERQGVDMKAIVRTVMENPAPAGGGNAERNEFQQLLFAKVVPNCKKLGLIDAGDGWLRKKFTEIGIIQFEDWVDTSIEYEQLDAATRGREVVGA
jgi:hypothetical protein